jgi:TATA-box binding protein (TBP) (component of TFIID and TFIIIB)
MEAPPRTAYSNLEIEEAAEKGGKHRVRALPATGSLSEPAEWVDLGALDAFAIKKLLRVNRLHTEEAPHPMWEVLSESAVTFVAPKRKYNKKKKSTVTLKRAERLRKQREADMKKEKDQKQQQKKEKEEEEKELKDEKGEDSSRKKKKRKAEKMEDAPAVEKEKDETKEDKAEKQPPSKKQRTDEPRPKKKKPVQESRFRVLSRRPNAKNKKKKKDPNISGETCILEVQQVVSKGKTGNTPRRIGDLRWNGLAGRYVPDKFTAVNVSLRYPPCTISHHGTGELGITGSPSEYAALVSMWQYERRCAQKTWSPLQASTFRAVNFTTRGDLGAQLDLKVVEREFESLKGFTVTYDPENISSVQIKPFRLTDNKKTRSTTSKWAANVFDSGLICVVGFSSRADIEECKNTFFPALKMVLMAMEQQRSESSSSAVSE